MLTCTISHKIGDKAILNKVEFSLEPGKYLLILGDSGAGKTTLFSILTGIQKPSNGVVTYNGKDIFALKSAELDRFRGENIGIIFQELHLVPVISLKENLQLANALIHKKPDNAYIDKLIDDLGLADKADQKAENLSIGEQQRVAIARALVNKPKWVFADEPTSALDDKNTATTLELLKSHAEKNGASLIIATHDKRIKDAFAKHTVIELKGGQQ
ncbi:MAG: transporter ATP-binding protein [Rickettsiaceae bacterium]|jgi:putative ABC transport system ATP-binding protein|nr:transporter ATP-binding protein [Rickettsiaceae bacterium]